MSRMRFTGRLLSAKLLITPKTEAKISKTMKTLKNLKKELLDLQRHPEPDQGTFESCGIIVREAAEEAAQHGRIDLYEQYKNVRHCSPRDGLAFLAHIEYEIKPKPGSSELLTVAEAAELSGIPSRTLYSLCKDGQLAHHRIGSGRGTIRIKRADLDRHLRQSRVELQPFEDLIFGSPETT